ncbi:MAG TPA: two-component regulator propeller domain-containing protein [Saprospiraceae bacterium]|nr:two-component regulator propeller domain-containing protein [Saprospiraceae bacterium]
MKHKLLIFFSLLLVTSCHEKPVIAHQEKPTYAAPDTIALNLREGYIINKITGDSIKHIYNSFSDTVPTGKPIRLRGKVFANDSFPSPVTRLSVPEKTIILPSNDVLVPPVSDQIMIDEEALARFYPANDTCACTLIGAFGDTIPYLTPIPLHGDTAPWMPPPLVRASKPAIRENARYNIQILDQEHGLTSPEILCLFQDYQGYMWLSTQNEFTQYDGTYFRNFNKEDMTMLRYGFLMLEDSQRRLWFSTAAGIICTDGQTYTTFNAKDGELYRNEVRSALEDRQGNIWFGSRDQVLMKYTPASETAPATITHLKLKIKPDEKKIMAMCEDLNGHLWFGTDGDGLFRYDGKSFTHYTTSAGLPDNNITSLLVDTYGHIWIGSTSGLSRLTIGIAGKNGEIIHLSAKDGLSNHKVTSLAKDHEGNIWISIWGGGINKLTLKDDKSGTPYYFTHITEDDGLSNNLITQIFIDRAGSVWAATADGGINIIDPKSFNHLFNVKGFTDLRFRSVFEDYKGQLWFGSESEGLSVMLRPQTIGAPTVVKQYGISPESSLPNNWAILEDEKQNLWFGSPSGVFRMDRTDAETKSITHHGWWHEFSNGFITAMQFDSKGNLWISTYGSGLIMFPPDLKHTIHYSEYFGFTCDYLYDLEIDQNDVIWIATDQNGLCKLEPSADGAEVLMTNYAEREGLPSNYLQEIELDPASNVWIGTIWSGAVKFMSSENGQHGEFITLGTSQGLLPGRISSMEYVVNESFGNHMWLASEEGLCLIEDDELSRHRIISFGKYEGLKSQAFNIRCAYKDHQDQMWWGTTKGLERFDLQNLSVSALTPKPVLRQIDINEQTYNFQKLPDSLRPFMAFDSVALYESYPHYPILSYKMNHLTFHFSAQDWNAPYKVRYSFKMDDSEEWSSPSVESFAEYRNLSSGTHTLYVKAFGESQIWSEPLEYNFTIRPPWWYSWWAIIMYSCFGGFVLYSTYRFQLNRKLEIAEKQRLMELEQIKNRLYTNITHEFRTPLTLIHGPVTQALSKNTVLEQKDIQSIHRQSERLQQLINQMLQLQKLEAGMLKPHFAYGEIIQVLRYLFGSFEAWAREKNISMLFSSSLQEVYMDFDQEKLTQIISNLVSNAIKHTPRGGKVAMVISTSSSADFLLISISDTGAGISDEDLPYIFDRFYQSKRASAGGTGIGLALVKNLTDLLGGQINVESKLDAGSTFKLTLPVTKHFHKTADAVPAADIKIQETHEEEINFITPQHSVSGKPIVLVVEDHPEVLHFVASCLTEEYTVLSATDGNEGLRLAFERIPDLIISDVMMPGKDGFELCNILKKDIQTSHIPIILLTGRGEHEAMLEGIGHGADAYIIKPFDPEELLLRVKKLLELRNTLSQYYRKHATTDNPQTVQQSSPKENEFLQKIRAFVEEHLNDPQLNMNMLSKHMAMSHPQLHRKITALTGESTGRFVRSVRLTRAMELLKNSDLTISEIAYETGFSEPGYFTKTFSKEYSMTPSEYRGSFH